MNNINNKIVAKLRTLGEGKSGKGMKKEGREKHDEGDLRDRMSTFILRYFIRCNAALSNQLTVSYKQ